MANEQCQNSQFLLSGTHNEIRFFLLRPFGWIFENFLANN